MVFEDPIHHLQQADDIKACLLHRLITDNGQTGVAGAQRSRRTHRGCWQRCGVRGAGYSEAHRTWLCSPCPRCRRNSDAASNISFVTLQLKYAQRHLNDSAARGCVQPLPPPLAETVDPVPIFCQTTAAGSLWPERGSRGWAPSTGGQGGRKQWLQARRRPCCHSARVARAAREPQGFAVTRCDPLRVGPSRVRMVASWCGPRPPQAELPGATLVVRTPAADQVDLGFGRIGVSEIVAPNI
jgi:hypothetical protein